MHRTGERRTGAGAEGRRRDGEPIPSPDEALAHAERCHEAIRRLLERSMPRDVAATLLREVFGSDHTP